MHTVNHKPHRAPDPMLWAGAGDFSIRNFAATRNLVGDLCEEMTAAAFGVTRLALDGRCDVCPDLLAAPGVYLECKGVGPTGRMIVYGHRHAKDCEWTREYGARLYYVVWHHGVRPSELHTWHALRAAMVAGVREVLVFSNAELAGLVAGKPQVVLNTKSRTRDGKSLGYGKAGYGVGWNLYLTRLRGICRLHGRWPLELADAGPATQVPVLCSDHAGALRVFGGLL